MEFTSYALSFFSDPVRERFENIHRSYILHIIVKWAYLSEGYPTPSKIENIVASGSIADSMDREVIFTAVDNGELKKSSRGGSLR
ncbi:hypothetical protein [Methanosphaerula subterraneus]|uniref:hypothetical protein n=1 Tax=Methanosphaerula subterraneus TaxID=3350244 RepID=UPI003F8604D3